MVKIFNSFRGPSPLAQRMSELGQTMWGDSTGNALKSEQLYAAQRENTEMDNLMRRVGQSGAQNLGADQIAQAILIGSGYKPGQFGEIGLMGAATGFGARDPRTQNWQVGTGQGFGNTADAFDTRMAEDRRQADMSSSDRRYSVDQSRAQQMHEFNRKPVAAIGSDGGPTFAPQGGLVDSGMSPIMSDTETKGTYVRRHFGSMADLPAAEREYLGAASGARTPRNYVLPDGRNFITYDGATDVQTGQPLPPGGFLGEVTGGAGDVGLTNSTMSGLQQQDIANTKFGNLLRMTRDLAQRDPTNFGIPGFIKGTMADINELANGLAVGMGSPNMQEAVAEIRRSAAENGVSPGLLSGVFDPNQAGLQTVSDLLVYAAAEALAGQSGRSVSDKDVQFFKGIVGDPRSWLMSQVRFTAKLDQLEQILTVNQQTIQGALGRPSAPAAGQPAPAAPAAPQGSDGTTVIDGVKIRRLD
jgi:hypothetical protein